MKLSGKEFERIQAALLDAYPRRDALRRLVRIELDENLDEISGNGNHQDVIFDLITWAYSTGRLDDLIAGAQIQNPGNVALQQLGHPSDHVNRETIVLNGEPIVKDPPPRKIGCTITIGFVTFLILCTFVFGWRWLSPDSPTPIAIPPSPYPQSPTPWVWEPPPMVGAAVFETITPSLQVAPFSFVSAQDIVNVRRGPGTDYGLIGQITPGQFYTLTGRYDNDAWLMIDYDDQEGWVLGQIVDVTGSLESISVIQTVPALPTALASAPLISGTSEQLVEATSTGAAPMQPPPPPPTPSAFIEIAIADSSSALVMARSMPLLEADVIYYLIDGTVLPAYGRTEDNVWILIKPPDGVYAWILSDDVIDSPALDVLPVWQ